MFLRKREWRKMQKYLKELEERVDELEDKFEYPTTRLDNTEFNNWLNKKLWANADSVKKDLYLLLDHFGLVLTTYTQRTVVEKITKKKGTK
jgi:hypothetical protein